eukprot:XP_001689655.1 predicted protein [Chlamydomonas reinhardtii]
MTGNSLRAWLQYLRIDKYHDQLARAGHDARSVAQLDDSALAALGLPLGPRKKIRLNAGLILQSCESSAATSGPSAARTPSQQQPADPAAAAGCLHTGQPPQQQQSGLGTAGSAGGQAAPLASASANGFGRYGVTEAQRPASSGTAAATAASAGAEGAPSPPPPPSALVLAEQRALTELYSYPYRSSAGAHGRRQPGLHGRPGQGHSAVSGGAARPEPGASGQLPEGQDLYAAAASAGPVEVDFGPLKMEAAEAAPTREQRQARLRALREEVAATERLLDTLRAMVAEEERALGAETGGPGGQGGGRAGGAGSGVGAGAGRSAGVAAGGELLRVDAGRGWSGSTPAFDAGTEAQLWQEDAPTQVWGVGEDMLLTERLGLLAD